MSAATCDGVLLLDCDGLEEGADPTAISKGTTAGQATAFSVRCPGVGRERGGPGGPSCVACLW